MVLFRLCLLLMCRIWLVIKVVLLLVRYCIVVFSLFVLVMCFKGVVDISLLCNCGFLCRFICNWFDMIELKVILFIWMCWGVSVMVSDRVVCVCVVLVMEQVSICGCGWLVVSEVRLMMVLFCSVLFLGLVLVWVIMCLVIICDSFSFEIMFLCSMLFSNLLLIVSGLQNCIM